MTRSGILSPADGSSQEDRVRAREAEITGKPPRMLPLDRDTVAPVAQALSNRLRRIKERGIPPLPLNEIHEIVLTLLRHPDLWERICELSIQLMGDSAKIPPRERELAILRILWLLGAPYAWGEHVIIAKRFAITSDEIEHATQGSTAPGWNPFESAILRAAEELHGNAMITDATWSALAEKFDESQLFELTALIGQFTNVAYFENSLRLRLSKDNPGLTAR